LSSNLTIRDLSDWDARPPQCLIDERDWDGVRELFIHWPGGPVTGARASSGGDPYRDICPCMVPQDDETRARAAKLNLEIAPGLDRVNLVDTVGECKTLLHGWQNYHMDVHGWCAGGYNVVGFQPRGAIGLDDVFWRFRGMLFSPAAQLHHNTGTLALMIAIGPGDALLPETKDRLRSFVRYVKDRTGRDIPVRPHSAVNDTSCPGPQLRAYIPTLNRV
jgi:hypothetical protein